MAVSSADTDGRLEVYKRQAGTRLLKDMPHLRSPGKIARVEAKGAELGVSTPHAHSPYCDIRRQLGIGRLTSKLEPAQCDASGVKT